MPRRGSPPLSRLLLFFILAALVIGLDQWSKAFIRSYPEGDVLFELGFFRIIHTQNTGAAFGLFRGASVVLAVIDFLAIAAILAYVLAFARRYLLRLPGWIGLSLVTAGTTSNLIDRLHTGSGITDFVSIGVWPAFNVADSAITVGVILLAITLLFLKPRAEGRVGER